MFWIEFSLMTREDNPAGL